MKIKKPTTLKSPLEGTSLIKVNKRKRTKTGIHGRPLLLDSINIEKMCKLLELGATDLQISIALEIGVKSVYEYKKHARFLQSVTYAENMAKSIVKRGLFKRAIGYSHEETKVFCNKWGDITTHKVIKHYPPEVNAINLWMRNKDKTWITSDPKVELNTTNLTNITNNTIKAEEITDEHKRRLREDFEILQRNGRLLPELST